MHPPFFRFPWLAALLLLAACSTTSFRSVPEPAPLLLVSIDGLRADVLGKGTMPTLDALAETGVRAAWMNPSYPTLTFPNHYTLVTGLRPDHHGIVHNKFNDAVLGRFVSKEASSRGGRFWGGEPVWVGAEKAGLVTATMFWPGSEAEIAGIRPRYWRPYDGKLSPQARVRQVLQWLDLPPAQRPRFMTLYLEQVDASAHDSGTFSPQTVAAMRGIDDALAALLRGLETRGLRDRVNLIVVSDHGMADIPRANTRYLDDTLSPDSYEVSWWGTLAGIAPHPGQENAVARAFRGRHESYECWRRSEIPQRWRYGGNPRIPPIVCQSDIGWRVQLRSHPPQEHEIKGEHGFRPEDPSMRAIFVASGPAFAPHTRLPAFDNVDVYPLLAKLLGLKPAPNDGDPRTLSSALKAETTPAY
ncbi:MAG TPA: ectonucleotide pyrophosphatase/phosphodiesterase [Pseudoxanthomonas sp.]